MHRMIYHVSVALFWVATTTGALAEDVVLFNGKDLEGWTFQIRKDEENPKTVDEVWVVQDGLLISTGACNGFLKHEQEFENYVLTLEWRSMRLNGNGLAVSGSGSVFVHTSDEEGSFHYPKSIEVGAFNNPGWVCFRDVDPFSDKEWTFDAPDIADDAEKDMGEWNQMKLICRGDRVTVFLNGTPINQVDGLTRTKGSIALQSQTSLFQAPSYYRNIRLQPLPSTAEKDEQVAAAKLAEFKAAAAQKDAAREAMRLAEEAKEKMQADKFASLWATINVPQDLEFSSDARKLPFPKDVQELQFDATFGGVEFVSRSSMAGLSRYYRTEMARRGWTEAEKERDEESIQVTFKQGEAKVDLKLDQESDGVDVSLDCRGLSFDGTNDPRGLVALGLPQPRFYVFLQQEFELPASVRDLEYDSGNRCLFKSDLKLQEAFDQLTRQLRAKGYRETRRPIVTETRRYTEFAKNRTEVSVNVFSHESGSRAVLTYDEK